MDLLPTIEETIALYTSYGFPEERAITIANNYALKIDMAREFENGATISMYHEKNNTEITGFHIFMEFLSFMTNHSPKKKKGR